MTGLSEDYDLTPEQSTRREIDRRLVECGWAVQNFKDFNPGASVGVAIREFQTDSGPVDYALFVDRRAVGVIEAKKDGAILSNHEAQTEDYARSKLKWQLNEQPLPFVYEATSKEVRFCDLRDPRPRFRELFSFHMPETLQSRFAEEKSLRSRFFEIPDLDVAGLRDCQVLAISNLEDSLRDNRPRALVQMTMGAGKTFTAITSIYRLLKFASAKRILFLVDTNNLGKQAEQAMQAFTPQDDKNIFTNIYNVQRLSSNFIDPSAQVCISTIQRLYSILNNKELDEEAETLASEQNVLPSDWDGRVSYQPDLPIETFDLIVIDECHRSIYNRWKQVLDYFDAFLVGLTATPDARTFGFFNRNVVSEYSYDEAVTDGVNVPFDVYKIETEITSKGAVIDAKEFIDKRSRQTREKRWEQLDEPIDYEARDLDKSVVSEDQIRTVLTTFKDKLRSEIFPERGDEVPKTLIFAKTDSHADDIIRIAREVFNEGNEFIRKITHKSDDPDGFLASFRTGYNPRVAVTVDMIATGTDVKPIECLIFMRNIKSKNYFEQMIGRGTRTFNKDDLQRVTPAAKGNKTHFVIIDAVGVFDSVKTDSRPLERKRSTPFDKLMMETVMGNHSEDNLSSLANRLVRLNTQLTDDEKTRVEKIYGVSLQDINRRLFDALNPDKHLEHAQQLSGKSDPGEVTDAEVEKAREDLVAIAVKPFDNPELRNTLIDVREQHDQIIDSVNLDTVTKVGFDPESKERAVNDIKKFKDFIEQNKDQIDALQIFYNQPAHRKQLTFEMVKELVEKLKYPPYSLNTDRVWNAYKITEEDKVKGSSEELVDVVSLVRRGIGIDDNLVPFSDVVEERYESWLVRLAEQGTTFTEKQRNWLDMIKTHIAQSLTMEKEDFDHTPFAEHGGLATLYDLFGDNYFEIVEELNKELVAV